MKPSLRSRIQPEAELLLHSARGAVGDADIRALLATPLNWDVVIALTERERAQTALWPRLCAAGLDLVPDAQRHQIQRMAMVAGFRQATLEQHLRDVLDALTRFGIDAVLLKGAALALSVYRSFADRPMADLDLLIPPDRAAEAQQLLLSHGWELRYPVADPVQQALYAEHHHLPPLVHGPARIVLEFHTEPLPSGHPFGLSARQLWDAATRKTYNGRSVLVPSLDHLAIHLALHFVWAHALESGGWRTLRDLRAVAELDAIDWQKHIELARAMRATSNCYWGWRLAHALVGARVPRDVLDQMAPSRSKTKLDFLERHFVSSLFGGAHCPSARVTRTLWEAAIAPKWSGHGDVRPWTAEKDFTGAGIRNSESSNDRTIESWKNLQGWHRYLSTFLFRRERRRSIALLQ